MNVREIIRSLGVWLEGRLFEIGGTVVTGASVLTFILVLLFTFWISWILQRVTERTLIRGGLSHEGTRATTKRLLHYCVLVVGLGVALQSIGISLASVFAAGAFAAVAIGFALQNILQNFVSGVILLVERSIKETDVLEVEGVTIRVIRMGARTTLARTRDDEELIIPNSILVQSAVKNLTLTDEVFRVRSTVGVSYDSDMRVVEFTLYEAAASVEHRFLGRDPVVLLTEFGDSSVVWEVSVWAKTPWEAMTTRSDLNKAIWWGLKTEEVTIAYPQLDLHVKPTDVGASLLGTR